MTLVKMTMVKMTMVKMTMVNGNDDHGHVPGDDVEEYEVNQVLRCWL